MYKISSEDELFNLWLLLDMTMRGLTRTREKELALKEPNKRKSPVALGSSAANVGRASLIGISLGTGISKEAPPYNPKLRPDKFPNTAPPSKLKLAVPASVSTLAAPVP